MDRIRTLLLARTHTVVLDPDRVASAATRPARDADVDRFEDELLQLGFVMSLDLGMTVRRFPNQAIKELRNWMVDTLAATVGAHRPHVPLFRGFPDTTPADSVALYARRVLTWLLQRPEQPCPWCGERKSVGALDPCGHLVCRQCWAGGTYAGCPICHRRVTPNEPFITHTTMRPLERIEHHDGELRLLHLAFDIVGTARERFERLMARTTPLSKEDRAEVEVVIDTLGPKAAIWLPARIPIKETLALAIARLWLVAPDRAAMVKATQSQLRTATDVLRVAAVLMGADPALVEPMRLASIPRSLRRAVLAALDKLPEAAVLEDVLRHRALWKRVGERLHPYEHGERFPVAMRAFGAVRGTDPATGARVRVARWGRAVEDALRAGDPRAAVARLAERPGELVRRADHLVRVACARQPDALAPVLDALAAAIPRCPPAMLLGLAAHVAKRTATWPRRVFLPKGDVLRAWGAPDLRPPLPADAIGALVAAARGELLARADARRKFARAVIDRGLGDLAVPTGERSASRSKVAWPRGSELALPDAARLRLFLHWEEPPGTRVDLDLSVAFYDLAWRHVATCDFTSLVVGAERAAVHSGDLTSAPPPLGASEFVDLDLGALAELGARHAVMVVFSYNAVSFDRLTHGFAGLMISPQGDEPFDPRAVAQRFDLGGRSLITVPLAIDLATRRLRWMDVHVADRGAMHQVGGYRAALAHVARDYADLFGTGARPTLWDLACIHAAARANIIYVREPGRITTFRRRDGETAAARFARVQAGTHDGATAAIPAANAPTWVALLRDDLPLPHGSAGFILDGRTLGGDSFLRLSAADLLADLAGSR
jgi:RING finger family protein